MEGDRLLSMRGDDRQQADMFLYGTLEQRIPKDHPLRPIRELADVALESLSARFDEMYAANGRPSIAPEKLLRALLLQALYSIRSERMLVEQLEYNLLFRWFVGLGMNERAWNHAVFSKNRERLLAGDVAQALFAVIVEQARSLKLLSDEQFSVDGTLLEAWASHKSFQPKDGSDKDDHDQQGGGFRGKKRRNDTHRSTSDPEAKLYRKSRGQEARLGYLGHVVIDNRHGLAVDTKLTEANGRAEREAALAMAARLPGGERRVTLGADKGYDTRDFVKGLREWGVTPHVAQNTSGRRSRIDHRTTRHGGYRESQKKRKLVEQVFGWMKTTAGLRRTRHRGKDRVGWMFTFAAAAYNLVRIRNLTATPA
jgi:transposase